MLKSAARTFCHPLGCLTLLLPAIMPIALAAQGASSASTRARSGVFVGTELEDYLRTLQTLGVVPLYPWSIRGFSPSELDRLRPFTEAHPWHEHAAFRPSMRGEDLRWELVPARLDSWYNSAFPSGTNDGVVWQGRGLTAAAQAGVAARWRPLSLIVAPTAFLAENRSFALRPNGQAGRLAFADGVYWNRVDRPQRFGSGSYGRADLGESTLRFDGFGVTAGISSASQWWGPMSEYPYVLGNNAGGFAHVFLGSEGPLNVWVGRFHARLMYGRLEQSAYIDNADSTDRLAAGLIAVFLPRGVAGLEIGAARFFHLVWPADGIGSRQLRKPFEGLLKGTLPGTDTDSVGSRNENQLASIFIRWVLPRAGFELYGEYGREDHSGDTRDLIMEPDHAATYGLGLRKAWKRQEGRITALRAEIMNYQVSILQLYRAQGGIYYHTSIRQGHTHRGQLLGAGIGVGSGAGALVTLERYSSEGKSAVFISRVVREDELRPTTPPAARTSDAIAVQYAVGVERILRRGPFTHRAGLTAGYEFNRDLRRDASNVSIFLGTTWWR